MSKEEMGTSGTGLIKDYERTPVPEERKKSWYNMGIVWGGVSACIGCLMMGGAVGSMLSLSDAIIAVTCGALITTTIGALCSVVGARLNLSTPMITRFAFGDRGAYIIALVLAFASYGWFAVQLGMFGETFLASVGILTGTTPGSAWLVPTIIIGGLLMISTALIGYRALSILSLVAVVPIVLLMVISVIMVMSQQPLSQIMAHAPANPMPIAFVISMVGGGFMVGAVIAPDVSRYAKSGKHSVGGVILGFFVFQAVIALMGVTLSHAVGDGDVIKIMLGLGWGLLAMLVLILAQWTTNDNNLYSASLAFSVLVRRWPKWTITLVVGVIGIILALLGMYGMFTQYLFFLGVLVPPIAGAYIADFFILNRDFYRYENLDRVAKARWTMLVSWIFGSFIALCTSPAGAFPGALGLFKITTIPAIDAFLVGFVTALILGWLYKKVAGRSDISREA